MKKFFYLPLVALASLMLASCGDDDDDYQYGVERQFADYFQLVTDVSGSNPVLVDECYYSVSIDYGNMVATIYMSKVPDGKGSYRAVTLRELPMKISSKVSTTVNADGVTADGITFSNLSFELRDRDIDNKYLPIMQLSYTASGRRVTAIAKRYTYFGVTSTTLPSGNVYTAPAAIPCYLEFDPATSTAELTLVGPKLMDPTGLPAEAQMPDITMSFPGIDAKFTHSGFTLSAEKIIPTAGGRPFAMFETTDLSANGNYAGTLSNLQFTVSGRGTVKANLTPFK